MCERDEHYQWTLSDVAANVERFEQASTNQLGEHWKLGYVRFRHHVSLSDRVLDGLASVELTPTSPPLTWITPTRTPGLGSIVGSTDALEVCFKFLRISMATHSESIDAHDGSFLVHDDVESHIPAQTSAAYRRWHPKISPYRLWVILTTIGFGTAKSVFAATGNSFIPTTLEWIAGTVIFLMYVRETRRNWWFYHDSMTLLSDFLASALMIQTIGRPQTAFPGCLNLIA